MRRVLARLHPGSDAEHATDWLAFVVCLPFVGIAHGRESFSLMPPGATAPVALPAAAMTVAMFVRRTVYLR